MLQKEKINTLIEGLSRIKKAQLGDRDYFRSIAMDTLNKSKLDTL